MIEGCCMSVESTGILTSFSMWKISGRYYPLKQLPRCFGRCAAQSLLFTMCRCNTTTKVVVAGTYLRTHLHMSYIMLGLSITLHTSTSHTTFTSLQFIALSHHITFLHIDYTQEQPEAHAVLVDRTYYSVLCLSAGYLVCKVTDVSKACTLSTHRQISHTYHQVWLQIDI
jgi:hypothetical protein